MLNNMDSPLSVGNKNITANHQSLQEFVDCKIEQNKVSVNSFLFVKDENKALQKILQISVW